jgi:pteridine reductase
MPVALVTGAGVRIGAAVALRLAKEGYDLALLAYQSMRQVESLAKQCQTEGVRVSVHCADFCEPQNIRLVAAAVSKQWPTVDLVVNNAAIFNRSPYQEITQASYRRMLAVNTDAPFFLTQALLPNLYASPCASVVNLVDIAGDRAIAGYAHYSLSKAALSMLTRALAVELAPRIRVNAIAPGTVAFPETYSSSERGEIITHIPLQRAGSLNDVAEAVVFLANATYVTGHILTIDGGRIAAL